MEHLLALLAFGLALALHVQLVGGVKFGQVLGLARLGVCQPEEVVLHRQKKKSSAFADS